MAPYPRYELRPDNVNAVILPNGKILIIGGHSNGQKWSPTPVLQTEIYDPATDKWTLGASLNFPRQYHSECVLLFGRQGPGGGRGRPWDAGPRPALTEAVFARLSQSGSASGHIGRGALNLNLWQRFRN